MLAKLVAMGMELDDHDVVVFTSLMANGSAVKMESNGTKLNPGDTVKVCDTIKVKSIMTTGLGRPAIVLDEASKYQGFCGGPFVEERETVNHLEHYKSGGIEVIDVIEAFDLNFRLGNSVKYILRSSKKGGVEDLKKAQWYLQREIARMEKKT